MLTGYLSGSEYDDSLLNHHRFASGIINLVKKHFDKLKPLESDVLGQVATILREKPADGSAQLQYLRQWIEQQIDATAKSLHYKKLHSALDRLIPEIILLHFINCENLWRDLYFV